MAAVTFPNIHCYVLIFLILIRKRVYFFLHFYCVDVKSIVVLQFI